MKLYVPGSFARSILSRLHLIPLARLSMCAREIVHNSYVVNDLAQKGAIFVNELDEVPEGARVIYSAHGVSAGGPRAERRSAA